MEVRNPNIVKILEEKGSVIENRHSGIPTMKREMKKYGLPEPGLVVKSVINKKIYECYIRIL